MASVLLSIRHEVVCRNYDQLTEGVADNLLEVVTASLARELITEETKNECLNETSRVDHGAKKLIDALTREIQLNDSIFDQFVSILHEIPALTNLAGRLQVDLNNRNGGDAGDYRISNGGDHRKEEKPEPKTEVDMNTDCASVRVDSTSKASESMPKPNKNQESFGTPKLTLEQHGISEPASRLSQVSNKSLVAQDENIPIQASDRSIRATQSEWQQSEKERIPELEREKLKDKKNYKTPVEIKSLKSHFLKKGAEVQMEKERKNGIEKVVRATEEQKVNAELQQPEAEAQFEKNDMPVQNEQGETKSRDKNDIEQEGQRNAEMEEENHQTAYDQDAQQKWADSGSAHQKKVSPVAISSTMNVSSGHDWSSESDHQDSEDGIVKSKPLTLDKPPIEEMCPGGFSNEYVLSSTPKGRRDERLPYVDAQQSLQAKDAQINGLKTMVEERMSSEQLLKQQLEYKTQEVEVLRRELKKQEEKHQTEVAVLNAELRQKNKELEDCKMKVAEIEHNHHESLVLERKAATQKLRDVEKEYEAKIKERDEMERKKCQGLEDEINKLKNNMKVILLEHACKKMELEKDLEIAKKEKAEKAQELAEKERELAEKKMENIMQRCEIDSMRAQLEASSKVHHLEEKNKELESDKQNLAEEIQYLRRDSEQSQAELDQLKHQISGSESPQSHQKPELKCSKDDCDPLQFLPH